MKYTTTLYLTVMLAAFGTASALRAETMSVPSAEKPAFTFDVPADWNPKLDEDEETVEATAPDEHVFLSSWLVTDAGIKDLKGDIAVTLQDSMSKVDPDTKEESYELNGIKFTVVTGSGIDKQEGGKVKFQVAMFPAGAGKIGIFYADYDDTAPATTMDVLQAIRKSIKVKA